MIVAETVSYTHLDVYKRQVEDSRPFDFGEDRLRGRGSLPATVFFYQGKLFFFGKR